MQKKKGKDDFIKRHEYPGGRKAFSEFIAANLVYPPEALKNKVEGLVLVEHDVGFGGEVHHAKVVRGIGSGCDEEALRLIRLLKFSPQNNHGTKIASRHKTKIHFKLPLAKEQPAVIQYNITKKPLEQKKKKEGSVSYTITLKHP